MDYSESVLVRVPMPLYEYTCDKCKKHFNVHLSYEEYGKVKIACAYCTSDQVRRRLTRIRLKRSDASRLADMPDPAGLEGIENDPESLGRMIRSMSKETGESLGPEFDEVVDRLESGQSAEEIERELPDFDGGDDSMSDEALD
jgi:putative FmdB family regulatory protein